MPLWNKTTSGQPIYTDLDSHSAPGDIVAVDGGWAHVINYTDQHGNVRQKTEILVAMASDDNSAFVDTNVGTIIAANFNEAYTPSAGGGTDVASITVRYSEAVTVTATPTLVAVSDGAGGNPTFTYASGTGTNELVFTSAALSGHTSGDILTITPTTSDVSGTINDTSGTGTSDLTIDADSVTAGLRATITFAA